MTTPRTLDSVADADLESLADEAGTAGDLRMVALCRRALRGDAAARAACASAIANARARETE